MDKITIDKTCEGYLWWSDQNAPKVYVDGRVYIEDKGCEDSEREFELVNGQNPFIVEGKLYDKSNHISYSIKYVDGGYVFKRHIVNPTDISNDAIDKKEYLSNRMDNRLLKVLRYWKETPDPLCEGWNVLTIDKNVFVGFKNKEE